MGQIQSQISSDEERGQNESSDEEMSQNQSVDENMGDKEGPRCIVSDPAHTHNLSYRAGPETKRNCFSCGNKDRSWMVHRRDYIHYYCKVCDLELHEKCLRYPSKMIHPYHPQHPLVFTVLNLENGIIANTNFGEFYSFLRRSDLKMSQYLKPESKPQPHIIFDKCTWCGNGLKEWFYRCSICNFSLDFNCARNFPPLIIQNPKSHHHSLSLFPLPLSFPCSACGLTDMLEPSYACYQCNHLVHQSCIDLPRIIKITRHPHRLAHTPYLPTTKASSFQICYKNVDIKYGQYTCNQGDCSYVVHSKCATHEKVWDGGELEWESEESDEEAKDIAPYKKVGGGLIKHFWHHHNLKLEKYNGARDSKKQCQACMRPITSHDFYNCIECDFFLHEVCANLPRKLDHALHKHSLFMDPYPIYDREYEDLRCSVCCRKSSGLKYRCKKDGCTYLERQFQVDVNCILVPEFFTHECHTEHPLFISTSYGDRGKVYCDGCYTRLREYHLHCTSCDFDICYECATIPNEIYNKYDEQPLSLCYGERAVDDTWCEVCEKRLVPRNWFYTNNERCTTIHHGCLFGDSVYMKPGHKFNYEDNTVEVVGNGGSSRPTCHTCHQRCPRPVYFNVNMRNATQVDFCSFSCIQVGFGLAVDRPETYFG